MPIESDKHNAPESAAEQSEKLSSAADLSNAGNLQKGKAEANPSTARNYLPSLEIENRSGADKNERSPSSEGHPDYKKELGDKQVLLAANLTHGDNLALIPKLSEIIDQLKDAKPPIATLGLEGFPSSWNEDFRKYMGDQMKEHGFFDNGFFENPPVNQKGFDKDAFQDQLQSWRSRVMAENIAKNLDKGRVIVSVGEGHLPHNPKGYKSIDEYLKRMGFEPKDLRF